MVERLRLVLGSGVWVMSITCELQDLEEIMVKVGVLLTGNAYDKAQDYLQDNCACATYRYLRESERVICGDCLRPDCKGCE